MTLNQRKRRTGVYKITSPSGRVYIGSSNDIGARWSYYRRCKNETQKLLMRSFKKYGVQNHKFEILCECSEEEKYKYERLYGDQYRSLSDFGGLNLCLPGYNDVPAKYSKETIAKMLATGKKASKETREKYRRARLGKYENGNHPMAKVVLNTETGIYYECIKEAADSLGLKRTALSMKLIGKNKNNTSLVYA